MKEPKGTGFTEAFKLHIVQEVESGRITKSQASERYDILGHSTILKWCRKYGRPTQKARGKVSVGTMTKKDHEMLRQANEIKALKKELEEARLKNVVYDTLIDVAERELHISIRKKYGAKQSVK